jgi:putative redox protein
MEMIIDFPGGSRVDAHFGSFTVATDQPPVASAPSPFEVFLSSIGTCAGIYLTGMVETIDLEIQIPPDFPEKYRPSLIHSAELCAVKKHLEKPPRFEITTKVV